MSGVLRCQDRPSLHLVNGDQAHERAERCVRWTRENGVLHRGARVCSEESHQPSVSGLYKAKTSIEGQP